MNENNENLTLDLKIHKALQEKLESGFAEEIMQEALENSIRQSVSNLFTRYGDVGKLIENKLRDILIPAIENYDFEKYVIKLDDILQNIIESTTLSENKEILENFKYLMIEEEDLKEITTEKIFEKYCEYVAENVDTFGLEVVYDYDSEPCYEQVHCSLDVIEEESYSWSSFKYARLILQCDEDESLNMEIPLNSYVRDTANTYKIRYKEEYSDIKSLRYADSFKLFLNKLDRLNTVLKITDNGIDDYITPNERPEK